MTCRGEDMTSLMVVVVDERFSLNEMKSLLKNLFMGVGMAVAMAWIIFGVKT